MAIVIVRHGQTALNAARVVQPFDTPLDGHGLAQAARVAERLRPRPAAALWSSHAPRALMTAEPIARATGLEVERVEALQERDFGDARGRPYAEVPQLFARDYVPANGESWEVFDARVARVWRLVVARAAELSGDLVVVTHGMVCRSMAAQFLKMPEGENVPFRWGNTSVTVVAAAVPHEVEVLNCTAHLDGETRDDGAAPSGM